jgi:hypothetical protein
MSVESLSAYLLGIMLTTAPPGRTSPASAVETPDEGRARYAEIAKSIADVVLDPAEQPIFYGASARQQTAALLLSISYFESGWRRDVDLGLGSQARGDSGNSWCLMQISVGRNGIGGLSGPDLVASRERCVRTGLRIVRHAVNSCRHRPMLQWLDAYASGTCERGMQASTRRMEKAIQWFGWSTSVPGVTAP